MHPIPPTSKKPLSIPLFVLFYFCGFLACIPGYHAHTKFIILIILCFIAWYLISQTSSGDPTTDLGIGSSLPIQILSALDAFYFTDHDTLIDLRVPSPYTDRITQQPLRQRVRWAFDLLTNPRGVGWAHEPCGLPPAPARHTPTRAFVLERLAHAAFCAIAGPVFYVLLVSNPALNTPHQAVGVFSQAPLGWRVLGTLAFGGTTVVRMYGASCVLSAVIVGLGLSTPERWPRLFGSPLEAWTLRRFWRNVWHQMLRKNLLAASNFILTTLLRFHPPPRNSSSFKHSSSSSKPPYSSTSTTHFLPRLRSLLLTFIAFFISGIAHVGGEWMLLGRPGYGVLTFFCMQGAGVCLEVVVSALWNQWVGTQPKNGKSSNANGDANGHGHANGNGNGKMKDKATNGLTSASASKSSPPLPLRLLGYLWVVLVFTYSVPYIIDPFLGFDMFVDPRFDVGLRLGVWGGSRV